MDRDGSGITLEVTEMLEDDLSRAEAGGVKDEDMGKLYPCCVWGKWEQ